VSKHFKYLSYIIRHKWFVFIACCRFGIPFRGLTHDLSKLLPSEWLPYCQYFYGGPHQAYDTFPSWLKYEFDCWKYSKEHVEQEFDQAWLFHQHRNNHHWQYWLLKNDDGSLVALQMPNKYVTEMVCDWVGAGRAITGKYEVKEWWQKNQDKMILHSSTFKRVQHLINNMMCDT
jgi:hypothetical protein